MRLREHWVARPSEVLAKPGRAIEDFANTSSNPEDILHFTKRYGVLHRNDKEWFEIVPGEEEEEGDSYCVHCSHWLESQARFRNEWERKGRPDSERAAAFAGQINPTHRAGRAVKAFVKPGKKAGFELE